MANSVKAEFLKSVNYGSFDTGNCTSSSKFRKIGYWKGDDEVRQTKKTTYILVAGSQCIDGRLSFCHHVFKLHDNQQIPNFENSEFVEIEDNLFFKKFISTINY